MQTRFGRVRLTEIVTEWEEGHDLNPRRLAAEVAAILKTTAPQGQPIHDAFVCAFTLDLAATASISHGALSDYFDSASQGRPPETINTGAGPIPTQSVMIHRQWINMLTSEAVERTAFVAGYASPANASHSIAIAANASAQMAAPATAPIPSGSAPGYVKMRQDQGKRKSEKAATEQLDEESKARQLAEAEAATLTGRLNISETDLAIERKARGDIHAAFLAQQERAEHAEAELAAMPARIAADFLELGKSLGKASIWLRKATQEASTTDAPTLLAVAGLLELLLERDRPNYTQDTASTAIAAKGWRSACKRKLNGVFSDAKKAAKCARAEATDKATDIQDSNAKTRL